MNTSTRVYTHTLSLRSRFLALSLTTHVHAGEPDTVSAYLDAACVVTSPSTSIRMNCDLLSVAQTVFESTTCTAATQSASSLWAGRCIATGATSRISTPSCAGSPSNPCFHGMRVVYVGVFV